jgi:hypothetical protein
MAKQIGSAQARVALLDRAALQAGGALICEEYSLFSRPSHHTSFLGEMFASVKRSLLSLLYGRVRKAV